MQQLSLVFEPGLAARSRSLREHFATRVYAYGHGRVTGILDCSPSHLSEKLAGCTSDGKPRNVSVDDLEAYIAGTGDVSPIHYLIDKYMRDPTVLRDEALAALLKIADQLPSLLSAAGVPTSAPAKPRKATR